MSPYLFILCAEVKEIQSEMIVNCIEVRITTIYNEYNSNKLAKFFKEVPLFIRKTLQKHWHP